MGNRKKKPRTREESSGHAAVIESKPAFETAEPDLLSAISEFSEAKDNLASQTAHSEAKPMQIPRQETTPQRA